MRDNDAIPPAGSATDSQLILWAGTVRAAPLLDRVAAAAASGYSAISLSPHDRRLAHAAGLSDHDIRLATADAGIRIDCYDPYTRWLPAWRPPAGLAAPTLEFLDTSEADFFRGGEAMGATSITLIEPFGTRWPDEALADCIATTFDRAASSGMTVNLEFIPFLGIPDLSTAWRLVQLSGRPARIVVDTWHYFRGTTDDQLLAAIPGDRIGAVQVSDAAELPHHDLETDCLHHRLPVGAGAFPLERVLDALRASGGLHNVGPEIYSDAYDSRPAAVNAREARVGLESWRSVPPPRDDRRTSPESDATEERSLCT